MTGEGLRQEQDHNGNDPNKFCRFYIGADGPDTNSSEEAKNLWDQIKNDFPFFPDLHHIFAARPNITPIAITTGVGPHGKKTLHMQPLSDDEDDIIFTALQVSQIRTLQDALNLAGTTHHKVSPSFETADDKENTPMFCNPVSLQTPIGKKPPKPSLLLLLQDSIAKAKGCIQKLTPKCSLNDMLFDIQKANLDAVNARACDEMKLKKRQCLLEEFKAGIWDAVRSEFHYDLSAITADLSSEPIVFSSTQGKQNKANQIAASV
ncbi:uncharacterized protein EDB91DRAFT_1250517 [Suillus paluster]|uniref:uncharacterized protein n=1 Tax=Suillus paluster TaxID=48578 RepID=UPI001B871699|nr:uncharacterized protein EDB91DRAFT_1250517 [Suillus paluster]KAG1735302.1 hypothetical protein EDB91DRAFT_1250517 [Suillus paluster]